MTEKEIREMKVLWLKGVDELGTTWSGHNPLEYLADQEEYDE